MVAWTLIIDNRESFVNSFPTTLTTVSDFIPHKNLNMSLKIKKIWGVFDVVDESNTFVLF